MASKSNSISDKVWSFFSSIKLAIAIFALIGLTSIVGTVIEQQASYETNIRVLYHLVGRGLAPSAYRVLDALGFMNMYRSWWFLSLLVLFAVNLLVCSIDRFPAIWRIMHAPIKPLGAEKMMKMPIKAEFRLHAAPAAVEPTALAGMKSAGFKAARHEEGDGAVELYAQKHAWSRAGVYLTHLSILIILAGAVAGILFGFKAMLNLPEGYSTNVVFSRSADLSDQEENSIRASLMGALDSAGGDIARAAQAVNEDPAAFKKSMEQAGLIPLDFQVSCQQFQVQYYGQTDMPKAYRSLLTVIDHGKPVVSKWVEVNHPLKYKGVMFYQSSYGLMDDLSNGIAVLSVKPPDGQQAETERLKIGQSFQIPGTQETVRLAEFNPALAFDDSGKPITYSQMMTNPAVRVEITDGKGPGVSKWIAQRYPETWRLPDGSTVGLQDFWGVQYTGLQVRKDPGVWIVYLGCITLALGLVVAFFMSHKKIWIRIEPEQKRKGTRLMIAATSNKNRPAFERAVEKLALELEKGGK
ncbi:MAG: cytochrome c biogenesis protein ResB [Nitrospiraceae bacterium]|nr:cytochrome c biogenesis protein ResB [Nitrospiraceae bacterium]